MSGMVGVLRSLRTHESGGVILLFALGIFVLITAVGVAIDMARYSLARSKMQYALDLAVLSAAAVQTTQDPNRVANQYFLANYPAKEYGTKFTSGSAGQPVAVRVDPTTKKITASVAGDIDTMFAQFIGLGTLSINVGGEALEEFNFTEVVLTLDNSPSMCYVPGTYNQDPRCRKLDAIKQASRTFVNKMFEKSPENIYIGLVPFNHNARSQPADGTAGWTQIGGVRVDRFPFRVVQPTPVDDANGWYTDTKRHPLLGPSVWVRSWKPVHIPTNHPYMYSVVETAQPLTNDKNILLRKINAMTTSFYSQTYTRTNVGTMVAGLMLMPYPQDRAYFQHEADLPHDFNYPQVQKVLVLMTDGENIPYWNRQGMTLAQYMARGRLGVTGSSPLNVAHISDLDNEHQLALCRKLKEVYGVTIFTVVYDLRNAGIKNVFRQCASNEQYFFDVSSSGDLVNAYDHIAESVRRIRLHK